jgi:ketosteroid isomerase-like protein
MENEQDPKRIRKAAKDFDDAVERRDIDLALSFFSDDCRIDMLGLSLAGKTGAGKWLKWLFTTFEEISFDPVTIMIEGDTFFEEFVLKGRLRNGNVVTSKQSEVLIYEDYKVKHLRLYFDRLDFAEVIGNRPIRRKVIKMIKNASLKDLK